MPTYLHICICRYRPTYLHILYMQVHAHIILCYICRSMSTDLYVLYICRSMPTISLLQAGSMMSGPTSEIGPSLRSTLAKTESTRHYKHRSCVKCTFPGPLLLHYKVIPFASHFPVPSSLTLLCVHRDRKELLGTGSPGRPPRLSPLAPSQSYALRFTGASC